MSFHRVLPLLSDQALRDRWAIQPDTLVSSKIMPDETTKPIANDHQSPTPAPRSLSSPPVESIQRSPGTESLEDYESPKYRTQSLSQAARTGNRPSIADSSSAPRKSVVEKWQEDTPSSICLCQPEPKVPRPRNGICTILLHTSQLLSSCFPISPPPSLPFVLVSLLTCLSAAFILYRQHHQQVVVAQNPGLANPEISKIIGDHWRKSSVETKEHWKLLADVRELVVPILYA